MSAEHSPEETITHLGSLDRFRNRWAILAAAGTTAIGALTFAAVHNELAHAESTKQATIGMPFKGKWAFDAAVNPPYTDANSSHPSVHSAYGFNWATDLYAAKDTDVNVYGSSSQGTVTFKRSGTSDTCSSYGANIAGQGVTFDVLVDSSKIGEVKYDHIDPVDVGNNAIASGTKIGEVTSEPTHSSCYQTYHVHIQFKNTVSDYSCYIDRGNPGVTLNPQDGIGILGSSNSSAKQACSETPAAGGSSGVGTEGYGKRMLNHVGTMTPGVFNPSIPSFDLRNSNTTGVHDITLAYGNRNSGAIPLACDWNGDGIDTIGLYNPPWGTFDLRNSNTTGSHDITLQYGNSWWKPLCGDWNGDGIDTIGVYDPNRAIFYLRNSNTSGVADITVQYGNVGAKPVTGDWNCDGMDTIGVFNPRLATFDLRNSNTPGNHDVTLQFGNVSANPEPLAGDWDGNCYDSIGLYNPKIATFDLRNSNSTGSHDYTLAYGNIGAKPVMGDFDGR